MGIAQKCIEELYKEFPKSLRVKKYEAMYLESEEKYEEALEILDAIIKLDDGNSGAKKRKIAILKAQNKNIDAIRELTEYLKMYVKWIFLQVILSFFLDLWQMLKPGRNYVNCILQSRTLIKLPFVWRN